VLVIEASLAWRASGLERSKNRELPWISNGDFRARAGRGAPYAQAQKFWRRGHDREKGAASLGLRKTTPTAVKTDEQREPFLLATVVIATGGLDTTGRRSRNLLVSSKVRGGCLLTTRLFNGSASFLRRR